MLCQSRNRMITALLIICAVVVNVECFLLENIGSNPKTHVNTECGQVVGTGSKANVFKGIPYAIPPLKERRWKAPEPLSKHTNTCWSGVFNASTFGKQCIQLDSDGTSNIVGDEDCLYLNVWTPTLNSSANLPVMVWIHGGSLQALSGNWPSYHPTEELARTTNIVYVSMNYRLSAFGFMALDILSEQSPHNTSGNYGFMDQQLALKWVQNNIRNFGGNPNLVTIFGQSSGGTSIIGLLSSPLSAGLFHRAWISSASPVYNKTLADASKDNLKFLNKTGCNEIKCLYNLSAAGVMNAIPYDGYPYWSMDDQLDPPTRNQFDGAICIVDGYVVPEAPFDMWKQNKGIDVPVIVGTTAQETDMSSFDEHLNRWTWDDYHKNVQKYLDTFPGNITAQAFTLYPDGVESAAFQYTTLTSDIRVLCPNNVMTELLSTSFKSKVYRYVVTQWPSHPVKVIPPFEAKYSFHSLDVYGFFGTMEDFYKPNKPTQGDLDFREMMQREMVNFARTGQPHTENWKTYPMDTAILTTNVTIVSSYHNDMCKFWDDNNFFSYGWIN